MWRVDYYTRPNGRKPAKDWIDDQDNSIKPSIDARIEKLRMEELLLIENRMLVPIREKRGTRKIIPGFYELKDRGKKWRIATYHNLKEDIFVLIWGWRRTRASPEREIDKARGLLQEYLSTEGE
ncbi:hypothetical protein ACFLUU_02465 [Chloroflexota bacterium]